MKSTNEKISNIKLNLITCHSVMMMATPAEIKMVVMGLGNETIKTWHSLMDETLKRNCSINGEINGNRE